MNARIKELRKYLRLNGEDFGKILGLSKHAISSIEREKQTVTERTISDICREFNVNEEWLREGNGEMFRKLTTNEELTVFLAELIGEDNSLRKNLIELLILLTPDDWSRISDIVKEFKNKKDKKKDTT